MQFTVETIGDDVAVVKGDGRLTMVAAPEFRAVVRREIEAGRARVVVDLGAVTFMDSSGLGALVGCLKTARQAGGDLRIAAPNDQVMMILRLSNLDRVFKAHESPEVAFHA
ncbi:STAS domain-containing protein [Herbiconiux sp. A18JL235]|uniref:Anti-sigma factor antagonist n=1 Tax=Herbiconiux sp. A18JL235 TaxID=3152363 RepID=A0AB39BLL7_9MICO